MVVHICDCGAYATGLGCEKCGKGKEPRCTACGDNGEIPYGEGEMIPCEMCQFVNGLPRPVVVRFADDMEQRLRENDHKGGWGECNKQYLANILSKAARDLMVAMSENASAQLITTRAADVANIVMMISDNEQSDSWPKDGVVIQDIDTGKFAKVNNEAALRDDDHIFDYVDKVSHSERYEALVHAQYAAYYYGDAGKRYRLIDYDQGGVQYILNPVEGNPNNWDFESIGLYPRAIPVDRASVVS